ncbi:Eukaryotic translation initiation factor 4G, partial [Tetrabaena socialis]
MPERPPQQAAAESAPKSGGGWGSGISFKDKLLAKQEPKPEAPPAVPVVDAPIEVAAKPADGTESAKPPADESGSDIQFGSFAEVDVAQSKEQPEAPAGPLPTAVPAAVEAVRQLSRPGVQRTNSAPAARPSAEGSSVPGFIPDKVQRSRMAVAAQVEGSPPLAAVADVPVPVAPAAAVPSPPAPAPAAPQQQQQQGYGLGPGGQGPQQHHMQQQQQQQQQQGGPRGGGRGGPGGPPQMPPQMQMQMGVPMHQGYPQQHQPYGMAYVHAPSQPMGMSQQQQQHAYVAAAAQHAQHAQHGQMQGPGQHMGPPPQYMVGSPSQYAHQFMGVGGGGAYYPAPHMGQQPVAVPIMMHPQHPQHPQHGGHVMSSSPTMTHAQHPQHAPPPGPGAYGQGAPQPPPIAIAIPPPGPGTGSSAPNAPVLAAAQAAINATNAAAPVSAGCLLVAKGFGNRRAGTTETLLTTVEDATMEDGWQRRGPPPPPSPGGDMRNRGASGRQGSVMPGGYGGGGGVQLHKSESRWQVGVSVAEDPEEDKKQKTFKGILNKLTPDSYDKLKQQILAVPITHQMTLEAFINQIFPTRALAPLPATLETFINQIFDKALIETTFSEMYANLCKGGPSGRSGGGPGMDRGRDAPPPPSGRFGAAQQDEARLMGRGEVARPLRGAAMERQASAEVSLRPSSFMATKRTGSPAQPAGIVAAPVREAIAAATRPHVPSAAAAAAVAAAAPVVRAEKAAAAPPPPPPPAGMSEEAAMKRGASWVKELYEVREKGAAAEGLTSLRAEGAPMGVVLAAALREAFEVRGIDPAARLDLLKEVLVEQLTATEGQLNSSMLEDAFGRFMGDLYTWVEDNPKAA